MTLMLARIRDFVQTKVTDASGEPRKVDIHGKKLSLLASNYLFTSKFLSTSKILLRPQILGCLRYTYFMLKIDCFTLFSTSGI